MVKKSLFRMTVAIALIIGAPLGLFSGAVYQLISPRELGIGMLAWFATLFLWAAATKLREKNSASSVTPGPIIDDRIRRRILRRILLGKVWIGALAVSLPLGIANGIIHRAWLPTVAGVAINLILTYATIYEIRRWRRRLDGSLRGA